MKRLFIQLSAAIMVLSLCAFHCNGAKKYTFQYNLEAGKTYRQLAVTDMNMAMNAAGQSMNIGMKMTMSVQYDVTAKNSSGYDMQMAYRQLKMDVTGPAANVTVDSNSPETSSDKNTAETLKALTGVPIDFQLTKQGKVTSVKGADTLAKKLNALANEQSKQMFSQRFSEKAIQASIENLSSFFPDKPVATGDSWDATTHINSGGTDLISKMTFTLKQVDGDIATLDCTGTIATPEGGANIKVQGMDAKVTVNGDQTGTVKMDTKTGWIVRSELTQKFTQTIEVMGQTIPQDVRSTTTITAE